MVWTTLAMEVATPLFNGGADPDGSAGFGVANDAGVRVGSIRGAMRFWFRAMAGGLAGDDLRLLGALERRVFGGIAGPGDDGSSATGSPLILRLPDPPTASREYTIPGGRAEAAWIGYLLGLGLMRPAPGGPRLVRQCVTPGTSFELKLRFQHPRGTPGAVVEAVEALALVSLWMACTYGGFGARVRRGFGGVRITKASGNLPGSWQESWLRTPGAGFCRDHRWPWPWPPQVFGVFGHHLPELIRAEGGVAGKPDAWAEVPPYPVLSRAYSPSAVVPEVFASWHRTLAYAGKQLRLFRGNRPIDDAGRGRARVRTAEWDDVIKGANASFPLGALGLPVGYQEKDTRRTFTVNAVKPGEPEPEQLRRASPLWLRPVGAGSSWALLTFAFQSRFLPRDGSARVDLLPNQQAIHDGWQRDELFVEQESVTGLTRQWLATMRAGGDFTRQIRDLSPGGCDANPDRDAAQGHLAGAAGHQAAARAGMRAVRGRALRPPRPRQAVRRMAGSSCARRPAAGVGMARGLAAGHPAAQRRIRGRAKDRARELHCRRERTAQGDARPPRAGSGPRQRHCHIRVPDVLFAERD